MKWEVQGQPYPAEFFGSFEPVAILYDFDGPRIFTVLGRDGDPLLAYQCDEDEAASRFVVVPCNIALLEAVQAGRASVRDALGQPWSWVVDRTHGQGIAHAWRVDLESIPAGVLPAGSVMLLPSMAPLLSVRMVGENLGPGETPASVIRRAVDGASSALKTLVEFVMEVRNTGGRPADRLRRLYDLRAQRVAFASFEIAFKAPAAASQESFSEEEAKTLDDVGALLERALGWAEIAAQIPSVNSEDEMIAATFEAAILESPEGDPGEVLAMLEALEKLTPPQHGLVTEVHVGGRLAGSGRASKVLTRLSSTWVRRALDRRRRDRGPLITLTGLVREFDKDKLTFILREVDGWPDQKCSITDALFDEAMTAFTTDEQVTVAGREAKGKGGIDVVAMDRRGGGRGSARG